MSKTRPEFIKPFHKKSTQKLTQEDICQNDEIITETGILCLKNLKRI